MTAPHQPQISAQGQAVGPRILFHCVNGNGMGHFMRMMALACRLRTLVSELKPVILTSCEDPGFAWREGITCVKVPSPHSSGLAMAADQVALMARQITASVFAAFNPQILVSDIFATGEYHELAPYLYDRRLKICLLSTRNLFDPLSNRGLELYDRAIVSAPEILRGQTALAPPEGAPWLPPVLLRNADRCLARAEARRHLRLPQDRTIVLVTMGGGGDPANMENLRVVIDTAAAFPDLLFAIVEPPLARFTIRVLGDGNVVSLSHTPLQEVLSAFDAAVSGTGASAIGEQFSAGLPSVWLPQGRNSPDQVVNARALAASGLGIVLDHLDGRALANAIGEITVPATAAAIRDRMLPYAGNGTDAAADLIVSWYEEFFARRLS